MNILLRTLISLIKSLNCSKNLNNINFELIVTIHNSMKDDLEKIKEILINQILKII